MNILSLIEAIVNKIVVKTDAIDNIELLELVRELINKKFNLNLKITFSPIDDTYHVDSLVLYFIMDEKNLSKVPENSLVLTFNKKLAKKFNGFFFVMYQNE